MFQLLFLQAALSLSLDSYGSEISSEALTKDLGYSSALTSKHLGSAEHSALADYRSSIGFYRCINGLLRNSEKECRTFRSFNKDFKEVTRQIDRSFTLLPRLRSDVVLFRGEDFVYREYRNYVVGEEFVQPAYTSTSVSRDVAKRFTGAEGLPGSVFIIYHERDFQGIWFGGHEAEVLLSHGAKYRVMGVRKLKKAKYVHLIQRCQGSCSKSIFGGDAVDVFENFN